MTVQTCEESIKKNLKIMHTNVVYSNIFYLLTGIYAIFIKKYLYGLLMILMAIISTIFHSNYNFIFPNKTWEKIDTVFVFIVIVITVIMIVNVQSIYRKENDGKLYMPQIGLLIIAAFGFMYFYLNARLSMRKAEDKEVGITGPLLSIIDDDFCKESTEVMLSVFYHTCWHLITGITIFMFVVTLPVEKPYV
jgi:hypothetical protein